jgi:hypothetical protein
MPRDVETIATTCPLCLGVDDPSSMIAARLEISYPQNTAEVLICRKCCFAINRALVEAGEAAPIQGVDDASSSGDRSGGVNSAGVGDTEAPALVLADRPGGESAGVDSAEPGADAGGAAVSGENQQPE